ncbi:hypothetical protein Y032_0005g2288 [Ancylostoma ceylanicum]|uniref:Uncharacterized protein n=1 Tax=Ancylostoma ceylanicum TaxID=53326 RepID=A0A016VR78_9BILA|nr:hypothetical protein Y032_0005g2288 [Ancylostoma ceylanicum]
MVVGGGEIWGGTVGAEPLSILSPPVADELSKLLEGVRCRAEGDLDTSTPLSSDGRGQIPLLTAVDGEVSI